MSGQASALGGCGLMEDLAHLLGAVVGDFHTDMRLIRRERLTEAFLLTLREPITRGAQEIADLIECLKQDYTSYSYTNLRDEVEIGQISFNASDKNYIDQMSDSYAVYPFCKKTLAYLEQKGYYESDRTLLDEVKRVEITYYVDDDYMNVKTENYDDRAEIEEIISSCQLSNFGTWWKEQNDYISDVYVSTYTSDGNLSLIHI